jgi:hypothetical protein
VPREDWGIEIPGGWYRDEGHQYRDEQGNRVPSSTQVFSALGMSDFSMVDPEDLAWKRGYGDAVHKASELLVFDKLDWNSCDEAIIPAVTGIEQFFKSLEYQPEAAEERMIVGVNGMKHGMALDHRGTVNYHGVRRKLVADVKTGSKFSPTWAWQLGSYAPTVSALALVVQVDKTGRVVPHWVDTLRAKREFTILLAAANLKLNVGLARLE